MPIRIEPTDTKFSTEVELSGADNVTCLPLTNQHSLHSNSFISLSHRTCISDLDLFNCKFVLGPIIRLFILLASTKWNVWQSHQLVCSFIVFVCYQSSASTWPDVLRPYNKFTSQSWLQNYCTHPLLCGSLLIDNELKHYLVAVCVLDCIRHSRLHAECRRNNWQCMQMTIYSILFCREMVTCFVSCCPNGSTLIMTYGHVRSHDRVLPGKKGHLVEKNFIRMLYRTIPLYVLNERMNDVFINVW